MREWVPISSSAKGRLALRALEDFGAKGFDAVNVVDVAAAAGVTTGSLYHHFGSKAGLYAFVRAEAERRLLDRMEGAAAATRAHDGRAAAVRAALLIGFDFATDQGFMRLLGEPHPERRVDPVAELLAELCDGGRTPIAGMLAGAWRAALAAVAEGTSVEAAREALAALTVDEAVLRAR
jgi:AcrR family transcriptional regulator